MCADFRGTTVHLLSPISIKPLCITEIFLTSFLSHFFVCSGICNEVLADISFWFGLATF